MSDGGRPKLAAASLKSECVRSSCFVPFVRDTRIASAGETYAQRKPHIICVNGPATQRSTFHVAAAGASSVPVVLRPVRLRSGCLLSVVLLLDAARPTPHCSASSSHLFSAAAANATRSNTTAQRNTRARDRHATVWCHACDCVRVPVCVAAGCAVGGWVGGFYR